MYIEGDDKQIDSGGIGRQNRNLQIIFIYLHFLNILFIHEVYTLCREEKTATV